MAEVVLRPHKRRTDRWMPRKRRWITRAQLRGMAAAAARCIPGYLLFFADILGIPSGMHAALGTALAATGHDVRPTIAGSTAAFIVRWISGMPPCWESLITLGLLGLGALFLNGRSTVVLMAFTAAAMLPVGVTATLSTTAAEMVQGWAAVMIGALSSPVMARAIKALTSGKHMSSVEERIAVGYLAAMCLCGGARMLLLGHNLGVLMSGCVTLCMALVLGVGAGTMAGMLSGVVLALQGLPLTIAVALSMGDSWRVCRPACPGGSGAAARSRWALICHCCCAIQQASGAERRCCLRQLWWAFCRGKALTVCSSFCGVS